MEDVVNNDSTRLYDLPPSYEEAQGLSSPHRYCEIEDFFNESILSDKGASNYDSAETAESPIYVDIEDVLTSKAKQVGSSPSNNVSHSIVIESTL